MPNLPNIFPMTNAGSLPDEEIKMLPGKSGKTSEPFGDLMARALSPAAKEIALTVEPNALAKFGALELGKLAVEMDGDKGEKNSSPQNSKAETRKSLKKNAIETAPSVADANAIPILPLEISPEIFVAAIRPKIVPVQVLELKPDGKKTETPIQAVAAKGKVESNVKVAAEVLSVPAKISVAEKLPETSGALPESTKIPSANAKAASSIVPEKLADVEIKNVQPNPAVKIESVKTDEQKKIAATVEIAAPEKINPADSKNVAATSASSQIAANGANDLARQKIIIKSVENFSATKNFVSPDLAAKVAAQAVSDVNGTTVAKQDAPMKKTEIPNKIASSAGKILPGEAVSAAQKNNLPPRVNFFEPVSARAEQMTANVAANSSASDRAASPESVEVISNAVVADNRAQVLERTQDLVALHALRLSNSSADSLQVVVKPDAGTQLSLELRQRGDGVEAQAILQRGDFEHLNQQWPGLQQQLEARGIRLAPLVNDGNFFNGSDFQRKQNQSAESNLFSGGTFAEIAPVGLVAGTFAQPAARAETHRGWETWA
jgi:hypothetical protein